MKRYRITLDGHTFRVKVLDDPRGEQVRVEVDGETFVVGVEAVPAVAEVIAGEAAAAVAPSPAALSGSPGSTSPPTPPEAGGSFVAAPLPGVIKSIAVRRGQEVAADDELLVIEAMKMDNVIRASRGGIVGAIHVTEGRQVAYGEPLLELMTTT
jgi:biotin carboxyl carrier protein